MAVSCKHSLERNSPKDIKAMFKNLFEAEYYSDLLQRQQSYGLHIRLETERAQPGCVSRATDLEETILEDISNSNGPLSTLVLGDSGTGKSWLALKLAKQLYDSTKPEFETRIPVYIPLARVEKMISQQTKQHSRSFRSDILFSYIMNHRNHFPTKILDGELQNLYLDLCTCELILILDGYDELKMKSNLWEENKWKAKDFKDVRTVVFSRPNAFVDVDVSNIFGFSKKQQSNYFISPIMGSTVEKYISQVPLFLHSIEYDSKLNDPWMMTKSTTKDYPKWESAKEDSEYKYWFLDRLPELQGLAQNVFILTIICQLLPKLVESERRATEERDDDFVQKLEEICRTEVLLYDKFTQAWFKYQIERMEPTGHSHALYENRHVLRHYMVGYAQNLAMRCACLNKGNVTNGEILQGETLFWNLWTPWSPPKKKRKENRDLEQVLFPQNEQDKNTDRLKNLKFLRDSCLLRYNTGEKVFGFLHLSVFEYFLSREVFEKFRSVLNYYSNWNRKRGEVYFPINQQNINDPEFVGVLSMLVGRAKTDGQLQRTLLETIKRSATLPGIERMASNAFTILNLSGFSFSGRNKDDDNFQNIQVPGANFRNSICGNSDFSGANFENAELNQGWFQGCKFQGVNFSNSSFGQIPPISLGTSNQCFVQAMFAYSEGNFSHLVTCYEDRSIASDLYFQSYTFQENSEFSGSKPIFLSEINRKDEHSFFFIENTGSVILLNFISTFNLVSAGGSFPSEVLQFWYEFKANCLVGCGRLDTSTLSLHSLLNYSNQFDYVQKHIVFFPNETSPIVVDDETFKVYGTHSTLCHVKYFWFAFGRFKMLVSVSFEYSDILCVDDASVALCISMLHNDKPILWNEESLYFELFWQIASIDDKEIEVDRVFDMSTICANYFFSYNVFYDARSHLTVFSPDSIYVFNLKNNTFLGALEKPNEFEFDAWRDESSERYSTTEKVVFFVQTINLFQECQLKWQSSHHVFGEISNQCFISENYNFIGINFKMSVEVFSVDTEQLLQTVLKDSGTSAMFICLKNDIENGRCSCETYLLFVYENTLHFESLQSFKTCTKQGRFQTSPRIEFISEDGLLSVHLNTDEFPTTRAYFLNFYYFDNGTLRKKYSSCFHNPYIGTFAYTHKDSILITPNHILIHHISIEHKLIGYNTKSKRFVPIEYRPKLAKDSSFMFFLFQQYQQIVAQSNHQLTCYSVTETCLDDKISIILTCNKPFELSFSKPCFAFDPNFANISYVYDADFDNNEIGVWNLNEKTYTPHTMRYGKTFPQCKSTLHTVLQSDKILQGFLDSKYFYSTRVTKYSESVSDSPVQVASSTKLGWIVAQFPNADLHILDSIELKTLFVFHGFQSVSKFQIVETVPKHVHIVVSSETANLSCLTINSESLRKYFNTRKSSKFEDWRVDSDQNSSTTLTLKGVDISYSRSVDKRDWLLLKFHGSLGSPAEGGTYRSFCNLFMPVTNYQHSILLTTNTVQPVRLTKKWIVTVIAKKNKFKLMRKTVCTSMGQHSALIIEGILHGGHFVIRAELTRDKENIIYIRCEPYRRKIKYEAIIKKYFGKQFEVHPHNGMKLLKNIWVDTYNAEWEYSILFRNCNDWCIEKLKVIDLEINFDPKFFWNFVSLPKDFKLKRFHVIWPKSDMTKKKKARKKGQNKTNSCNLT